MKTNTATPETKPMNKQKVMQLIKALTEAAVTHYAAVNGLKRCKRPADLEMSAAVKLLKELGLEATPEEVEAMLGW